MRYLKSIFTVGLIAGAMLFTQPAKALIVGQAVDFIGIGSTVVGSSLVDKPALGGDSIEYFIPLGASDGVYGVSGFGTTTDNGKGGGVLTMFLRFDGLTVNNGSLSILFEDLDLDGVNDPTGFLETAQVFDQAGTALTQKLTSVSDTGDFTLNSSGSNAPVELVLLFGPLAIPTFFVQLDFTASFPTIVGNSAEYLRAVFTEGQENISQVPLPAALPLYGTGLAIMGLIGWRRKRRMSAA